MKTKTFVQAHAKTYIPLIDEIRLHLVITSDIKQSHEEFKLTYTPGDCACNGAEAHMDGNAFDCYVFITNTCVTHEIIAHELHHATHQICQRIGAASDQENDELTARIIGWTTAWVYKQLEKAGIPVLHKSSKS